MGRIFKSGDTVKVDEFSINKYAMPFVAEIVWPSNTGFHSVRMPGGSIVPIHESRFS